MLKLLLIVCIFCAATSQCYKILLVFPVASRSHHNLGSALAKGLSDVGHDVTIVSPYEDNHKPKKGTYREIILTGFVEDQEVRGKTMNMFEFDKDSIFVKIGNLLNLGREMVEGFFQHENIRKLLHSNETFDAVIMEQFLFDALKGLHKHFNAHQIILNAMASTVWSDPLVGNPSLPSYQPEVMVSFPAKMDFWQRLSNTFVSVLWKLYTHLHVYPSQNELLQKYLPDAGSLYDTIYNVSLLLVNSDYSLTHAHNKVPNMVDIAGYHLKLPKKLPKDLQEYLDSSKNGVVYFSMGSVAQSKTMPIETRNLILKSLGSLKEDVLWKWEEDKLPGQPKNVRIEKWLPQESLLAHPNVKLFITHGGFLSTIETTYYGKPIVAIPLFGDQQSNAKKLEENGIGKYIPYADLEEDKLTKLIKEVISNPKYAKTAKLRSALMRDRQVPPLETAIYWVEYVIRHNGAKHLRVAALDLTWYQYYLLDVIGFLVVVLFLSLFVIKKLFSWLCCRKRVASKKAKQS